MPPTALFDSTRRTFAPSLPAVMAAEAPAGPDRDTDQSAESAEHGGLYEKLRHDTGPLRPDCPTYPDFPRAFRDRHQHDIHNADTADEQRDSRDSGEYAADHA